jgi:nitrile hydratase
MDGIHDLGGMEGFGAVDVNAPPFRADWERRMWAIAKNTSAPDWTLDWWRHMVERMEPATYLSVPYFEKWCLTYLTGFVSSGLFTLEEGASGIAGSKEELAAPKDLDALRRQLRDTDVSFELPIEDAPQLSLGDTVRARHDISAHHTRLPRYVRGHSGRVTVHHGAHVFPDLNAEGVRVGQHLYTVEFSAAELWGSEADPRDVVALDLWESYLVSA